MQELIEVPGGDLRVLKSSRTPCLPVLSNEIAANTNGILEAIRALLGMIDVRVSAKRFCFIAKPSSKESNDRKPAPPPLRSKPAQATASPNYSKPVTKENLVEKKPVPKNIVAERQRSPFISMPAIGRGR